MNKKNWLRLIFFVAVSELAGIVGSFFTTPAIKGWYSTLIRPEIAPPNAVFGPVWTTLYALMGIAMFLVWKNRDKSDCYQRVQNVFFIQLVLNTLWSIIFFGMHNLGGALIEIIILWVVILLTIIRFARFSKAAMFLLIPYILWVSFATCLNYAFWLLN